MIGGGISTWIAFWACASLNLIVSIPLRTYINFIKLSRLYTTNK